jgi:lysylphosphatidylglycerol synthetase-like protein (DUF2156 family)
MITLITLTLLLFFQLSVCIYIHTNIDINTSSGSDKGDISKNLILAAMILAGVFFIFIMSLYFGKFIDYYRAEFLLLISVLLVGIVLIICYHYLDLQLRSGPDYRKTKDEFKKAQIRDNILELELSLSAGIIGLVIAGAISALLLGKYLLAEEKIIKIKEPVYMNMQSTVSDKDYREPDYMSEVSKNFIV